MSEGQNISYLFQKLRNLALPLSLKYIKLTLIMIKARVTLISENNSVFFNNSVLSVED